MTLTLKELEAVAAELDRALSGSRLAGLRLADAETVLLAFDTAEGEVRVLACVRPRHSRIHRTRLDARSPGGRRDWSHPFLQAAAPFIGATVARVAVRFGDRVAGIEFSRPGEPVKVPASRGPHPRRRTPERSPEPVGFLLFECTGHHPNLFWTDPHEVILASLVPSRSHRRDLRSGRRYQPPLPHASDRMDALRFLPAGRGALSDLIEAHYDRLGRDEARTTEEARARRDLRRDLERLARLRDGLARDLSEQERAAALLEADPPPRQDSDRLKRLAGRRVATREHLARVTRRIERLERRLGEVAGGEGLDGPGSGPKSRNDPS